MISLAGQIDPAIWEVVAHYQVPYIAMHMRGTPQTMQSYTEYQNLTTDILYYFSEIKNKARQLKINDLIVDPGFGFSKTLPSELPTDAALGHIRHFRLSYIGGNLP